jgi:hypothetical protein
MSDTASVSAPGTAPVTETAAPATGDAPAATPTPAAPPQTYKVKVNGKELQVSREEILSALEAELGPDRALEPYAIKKAAMQKFDEAARMRKQIEAAAEELKDPKRALALLKRIHGPEKARRIFEEDYAAWLQEQATPPEERARKERETQLERRERELKEQEEALRTKELNEKTAQARAKYAKDITSALESAKMPKAPHVVAMVAGKLLDAGRSGITLSVAEAVADVREELSQLVRGLHTDLDGEGLVGLLGEDALKKIRQREVAALKAVPGVGANPAAKPAVKTKEAPTRKLTTAEFFEQRRNQR